MIELTSFASYNFDNNDYEFEQKEGSFIIKEAVKSRAKKNKTAHTVLALHDFLSRAAPSGLSSQSHKDIKKFVACLQAKIERKILENYPPCIGNIILTLQRVLGIGPLSEITTLESQLQQIPNNEKPVWQISIKSALSDFYVRYKDLIQHLNASFLTPADFKQKLVDALAKDTNFDFLESAFQKKLSTDSCKLLLESLSQAQSTAVDKTHATTCERVQKRFLQIHSAHFETAPMSDMQILHIAFFIEVRIHKAARVTKHFFRAQDVAFQRSLHIDAETNEVFLLADLRFSILKDEGTFKTVGACVRLAKENFNLQPEIAAYLMTRIDDLTKLQIKDDMKNIVREIAMCKRFRNTLGVAKYITSTKFTDDLPIEGKVQRMNLIFEKADGNLYRKIFESSKPIPFTEQLTIAKHLISAIQYLHSQNVIHADIKLHNALYLEDASHVIIQAMLCDFGCAFEYNQVTPLKTKTPEVYLWGHSGTDKFSPPELYGHNKFKGNYFKVDSWALGCLLYQLHFHTKLPWQEALESTIKKYFDDTEKKYTNLDKLRETQELFAMTVEEKIEAVLDRLKAESNPSEEVKFRILIFNLLRLKPADRFTLDQAAEQFACIYHPETSVRQVPAAAHASLGLEAYTPDEEKA
jgi:serine/threonine protein kinase